MTAEPAAQPAAQPAEPLGITHDMATPFQKSLGIRWHNIEGGTVVVECDIPDHLRGPAGSLEGGVVTTLVDVAGGSAAARALGTLIATADMTVHFVAPAKVGPVRATGVPLRVGNDGAVVEVKVFDRGNDDRLCATALLNFRALRPR